MLKSKMTVFFLGIALSSHAFAIDPPHILEGRFGPGGLGGLVNASWGDHFPGPQPTIPPVKLLTLASGQFGPIQFPQPVIPPAELIMTSGQAGGYLPPSGPRPFPLDEELPMILASISDMDSQLEGFSEGVELTMRELGAIIQNIYALDHQISKDPETAVPGPMTIVELAQIIKTAGELGYIESATASEIVEIMSLWTQ